MKRRFWYQIYLKWGGKNWQVKGESIWMRKILSRHPSLLHHLHFHWDEWVTWGQRIHVTPSLTHTAPFHKTNMNLLQAVIYAGKPTGYHFFIIKHKVKRVFLSTWVAIVLWWIECAAHKPTRSLEMWWKTGHKEDWVEPFKRNWNYLGWMPPPTSCSLHPCLIHPRLV